MEEPDTCVARPRQASEADALPLRKDVSESRAQDLSFGPKA